MFVVKKHFKLKNENGFISIVREFLTKHGERILYEDSTTDMNIKYKRRYKSVLGTDEGDVWYEFYFKDEIMANAFVLEISIFDSQS